MLEALAPDLWTTSHQLRFFGIPLRTRMTVMRFDDGSLLLHGPVPRTAEMARAVDALGPVRWVVAPNRYHHLWAGDWAGSAALLAAPGLAKKRKDLRIDQELRSPTDAPPEWAGRVELAAVEGLPFLNEVVLLHRASRTLLVADLFFNYPRSEKLLVRIVRAIEDCNGKFVVPRFIRLILRRAAFARSIEPILSWDFDRIVVAHGEVLETGGHALATKALERWRNP